MTTDSVLAELTAIARTQVQFEVVPGLGSGTAVPAYAGLALGSAHTEADVRAGADWAALAAAPGPLGLHAAAGYRAATASALGAPGRAPQPPAAVPGAGT